LNLHWRDLGGISITWFVPETLSTSSLLQAQEKINILGMVISAIDQAKGIEPDPFRFVGTMKEQEATMREYIGGNLCYIPEYREL
jgi:hypothetical protein